MTEGRGRNNETKAKEGVPLAIRIPVYREPMHLRCITLRVTFAETREKRSKEESLNNFVIF